MASSINASSTAGVVTTADTSGVLNIQTAGTTAISIDASQAVSFTNSANLPNTFGFKNRIINGAMVIDQRNAGASLTINSDSGKFSVDRWYFQGENTDGVFTVQQSSTAPTGFSKSMLLTVTTADASIGSSQAYFFNQSIEGFNVADLNWGTASATTITLSFWVYSSLTGTFGAAVTNSAFNRSYPFTFAISSANTWEQKTVTIAGDTTGTWAKDNTSGMRIYFGVGVGSTLLGTANAWSGTGYIGASGQTNLISTSGATFYITGVQLEKGATATSFDYRDYGRELIMCQRYFQKYSGQPSAYLANGNSGKNGYLTSFIYPVKMRTAPTASNITGFAAGNATTYAFSTPSISTTSDGLSEIFGASATALNYSEPFCAYFTTLDLSAEL